MCVSITASSERTYKLVLNMLAIYDEHPGGGLREIYFRATTSTGQAYRPNITAIRTPYRLPNHSWGVYRNILPRLNGDLPAG